MKSARLVLDRSLDELEQRYAFLLADIDMGSVDATPELRLAAKDVLYLAGEIRRLDAALGQGIGKVESRV